MTLVTACLRGGLGNQLFQWSAACTIAKRLGGQAGIDPRFLPTGIGERLQAVNIRARVIRAPSITVGLLSMPGLWCLTRALGIGRLQLARTELLLDTLRGTPDPDILLKLRTLHVVMVGYWQSTAWVDPVETELRAALSIPAHSDAVALHVRRGDYLSNSAAVRTHGTLSGAWYLAALDQLGNEARGRPLHVFTDDPSMVQREGWLPTHAQIHRHNSDVQDLLAMAGCAHLICANSSFSWWAAWIGERLGRIVICPERWWTSAAGPIPHPARSHWRRL